ncbi:hypothetical protein DFJ63DRAFT_154432 [Scheffersomyces coipomensis]|uniref:uncharacterized protein n=1 Tax=Scheffersomyces coipomensis TaxID=1788519 RepID=UPI00315DCF63
MPPSIRDIKVSLGKVQVYLEELSSSLEERERLVSVLKLTPSANDNYDLITLFQKLFKYLNYLKDDLEIMNKRDKINVEELNGQFQTVISRYNQLWHQASEDGSIDVGEFKFNHITITTSTIKTTKSTKEVGQKSVRFQDDVEADDDHLRNELMGTRSFRPYTDAEGGESDMGTDTESFDTQTNQQMFAQHQQIIHEQDSDLDLLHESVRRQHSMGMAINTELDDHIIILNDLESGIDQAQYRLNTATRRLNDFRKTCKENGSLVTIVVLTVILILLLVVLN